MPHTEFNTIIFCLLTGPTFSTSRTLVLQDSEEPEILDSPSQRPLEQKSNVPSALSILEIQESFFSTFRAELVKADKILSRNATSESGEPVERLTGIDKLLVEALPQLGNFCSSRTTPTWYS
ncbi:hypothetical protein FGADI_10507 [Fusarium gaditjirri]|uniref:Uncharacterized protein n=1 Tax=Fusarium gaditjirri TaxID=282569 RepID=A0A8H4WQP4_9HYPO|nr:hypothetical protein FGADI_10507 [Fusarium gaditjirri]